MNWFKHTEIKEVDTDKTIREFYEAKPNEFVEEVEKKEGAIVNVLETYKWSDLGNGVYMGTAMVGNYTGYKGNACTV